VRASVWLDASAVACGQAAALAIAGVVTTEVNTDGHREILGIDTA
jgi:transposase-like protein